MFCRYAADLGATKNFHFSLTVVLPYLTEVFCAGLMHLNSEVKQCLVSMNGF
jgi:hypothetical protein